MEKAPDVSGSAGDRLRVIQSAWVWKCERVDWNSGEGAQDEETRSRGDTWKAVPLQRDSMKVNPSHSSHHHPHHHIHSFQCQQSTMSWKFTVDLTIISFLS